MTAQERIEQVKANQRKLHSTIEKVLTAESSLDWCYTPAKPLIVKVYRLAREEHGILFADDFIKCEIGKVSRKMRKEMRTQSAQPALQAA